MKCSPSMLTDCPKANCIVDMRGDVVWSGRCETDGSRLRTVSIVAWIVLGIVVAIPYLLAMHWIYMRYRRRAVTVRVVGSAENVGVVDDRMWWLVDGQGWETVFGCIVIPLLFISTFTLTFTATFTAFQLL